MTSPRHDVVDEWANRAGERLRLARSRADREGPAQRAQFYLYHDDWDPDEPLPIYTRDGLHVLTGPRNGDELRARP